MYDIDVLKKEYIGKEFGWLTVVDVIKRAGKPIEFICKCKCGNEITRRWDKVNNGHIKSCGCYRKSEEVSAHKSQWFKDNPEKVKERSDKYSQWCKDNPEKVREKSDNHRKYNEEHREDIIERGRQHSQWCKDNQEKLTEQGRRHSQWFKDNPEKVALRSIKHSQWFKDNHDAWIESYNKRLNTYANNSEIVNNAKEKYLKWCRDNPDKVKKISKQGNEAYVSKCALHRRSANFSCLESIIRDDFVDKLYSGEIKFNDLIFIRCSTCGEYLSIKLGNVFDFSNNKLINNGIHLCTNCRHVTSSYEQEIANYVSTFYHGECLRNSRDIVKPLELDLYYPEKKIAIEFNGDYWHSDKFKSSNYHYNKFYKCLENGIILVSIFNYYWHMDNNHIKEYLLDLFNGNENSLSFDKDNCINNNYPTPWMNVNNVSYNISYYKFNNHVVYTCGYSSLRS